jgi:hypothetical protein
METRLLDKGENKMSKVQSKYIEPKVCPKCTSDNIQAENTLQCGFNDAWREVICNTCNYVWDEIFVFNYWDESEKMKRRE